MQKSPKPWVFPFQIIASIGVIALLVGQADVTRIREELAGASIGWLLIATLIKAASLTLHEIRLWISLWPDYRRPGWPVIAIGYTSGLANAVLPARGGDIVAAALLKKEVNVPVPAALAAVGVTALLEALVFALFLLGVMVIGATQWEQLIGPEKAQQAKILLIGCCIFALIIAGVSIAMARRKRRDDSEKKKGLVPLITGILEATGSSLGAGRYVLLNLILAAVQVVLVVGCFAALLPTVGLQLEPDMPLMAVSGVIAFGALSAIVLPPSLGAGPAVAAVFVFGMFGVSEDQALAFAAMSWIANTAPVVLLGFVPLWRRLRHFGSLKSLISDVEESSPDTDLPQAPRS